MKTEYPLSSTLPMPPEAEENLLIIACSGAKAKEASTAMDLYLGVMYQTLRTHLNLRARPHIRILSALHGFIDPYAYLEPYDLKMSPDRSRFFAGVPLEMDQWPSGIKRVFLAGGAEYRRVMLSAVKALQGAGRIVPNALVEETHDGIGSQRAQLGEYLRSLPTSQNLVGQHPNGNPLFRSLGGFYVDDNVVAHYRLADEGERAVVRELFFGAAGPTATVSMVPEKPTKVDYHRWVGLKKLTLYSPIAPQLFSEGSKKGPICS